MKTKNLYSILLGMTLVACLTGCKSDETTGAKPAKELVMVGDKEIVIAASETGTSVAVTADCYWEITDVNNSQWDPRAPATETVPSCSPQRRTTRR